MFALPGILLLLTFVYVRPQEFLPALQAVPMIDLSIALALLGMMFDIRQRRSRLDRTSLLTISIVFLIWCVIGLAVRNSSAISNCIVIVGVDLALYVCIAHGVQSFRALQIVAGWLLVLVLFVSAIGVHQGLAPLGCHQIQEGRDELVLTYDGRPCDTVKDCRVGDPEPGAEYLCEHVGLFQTSSIGGRVRYRGRLNDPNDLSLAIGIALPFAFALFERKRSAARLLLVVVALGLIGACTVYTASRGGQLVFLTVIGAYCIRRFGWKGLLVGAVVALPILLLGGRSGEEAESSSVERLECWYEGMSMVRSYPLFGVGQGQFVEHHILTAHNSYVLAAAELGLPGLGLFSTILYVSVKGPVQALRRLATEHAPNAAAARTWAMALLSMSAGVLIGIFFLSYCYHPVLWIALGLSGAFSSAMRTHDPEWKVRFGWRDLLVVMAIDVVLMVVLYGYTRIAVP